MSELSCGTRFIGFIGRNEALDLSLYPNLTLCFGRLEPHSSARNALSSDSKYMYIFLKIEDCSTTITSHHQSPGQATSSSVKFKRAHHTCSPDA
jgi:hypothetical protein